MRTLIILSGLVVSALCHAQEYSPYPQPRITPEQWQAYFDEVVAKRGASRRDFPAESLVVFDNQAEYTSYTFTQPGHPAHPAWITRQAVREPAGFRLRQVGFYAGDQVSFGKLFRSTQNTGTIKRGDSGEKQ